jgi:hypothetical protein
MDFARKVVKALEVPHTQEESSSGGLQFVSVSLTFDHDVIWNFKLTV